MKWVAVCCLCLGLIVRVGASQATQTSHTSGSCSPAVAGNGNTINIVCSGVNTALQRAINKQFHHQLNDRDLRIEELSKEIREWKDRYDRVVDDLSTLAIPDSRRRKAEAFVKTGKLEDARRIISEQIDVGEHEIDEQARNLSLRGSISELEFNATSAMKDYGEAYHLRPANTGYAHNYARLLYKHLDFHSAEAVLEPTVERLRAVSLEGDRTSSVDLEEALELLGVIYTDDKDIVRAEKCLNEALSISRKLALTQTPSESSAVAFILINWGNLFVRTLRYGEAEKALTEARDILRPLAASQPEIYGDSLAIALNDLGLVYTSTTGSLLFGKGKMDNALAALLESVEILRKYPKPQSASYQADLAERLSSVGFVYKQMGRPSDGLAVSEEALKIRRELTRNHALTSAGDLPQSLQEVGEFYVDLDRSKDALPIFEEAHVILEPLAISFPTIYSHQLSSVLQDIAGVYDGEGRIKESDDLYRRSVELNRNLSRSMLPDDIMQLASALVSLGLHYKQTGREGDAAESFAESYLIQLDLMGKYSDAVLPEASINAFRLSTVAKALGKEELNKICSRSEEVTSILHPSDASQQRDVRMMTVVMSLICDITTSKQSP